MTSDPWASGFPPDLSRSTSPTPRGLDWNVWIPRVVSKIRDERWFVLIVAIAIAVRLFHFNHPPNDAHEFRQTQTLIEVSSYAHGAPWLTPQGDWYGINWLPVQLEFPSYQIIVYWMSRAVGLLTAARLASFLFGVAAILLFDRIVALRGHPRRRTATALFAFAPLAIFYSHSTQPESLLLLLILASAYAALRATNGSISWLVAAAISLAGAATIKPTALVALALPIGYLAWRSRRLVPYGAVLVFALAAVAAWGQFDRTVLLHQNPSWYDFNARSSWVFGRPGLRLSPIFYRVLAERASLIMLPPLTVGLAVRAFGDRAGDLWWWWWAGGALAAILIFAELNYVHFYYQLPLVPALAALAAYGSPPFPSRTLWRGAVVGGLVLAAAVGSRELYAENNPILYHAGTALAVTATPGRPVIAMSAGGTQPWLPILLYYVGRPGWVRPLAFSALAIDRLPGPPPCDLVEALDGPAPAALPDGWREVTRTQEYVIGRRLGSGCPP